MGRLHTRYAPVRRSPARYCYRLLPLDLHVLSLPLAFILSQDQTLHCKNCSFTFLTRLRVSHIYSICMPTHAISFFSSVSNIARFFFNRRFFGESGCKDTTFFQYAKIFFQKFPFRHADSVVLQRYASEKNFHTPRFSDPQNGAARAKKGENWRRRGPKRCFPVPKRSIALYNSGLTAQKPARRRELSTAAPSLLPHGAPTDPVRPFFSSSSVVFQCRTEEVLKNY